MFFILYIFVCVCIKTHMHTYYSTYVEVRRDFSKIDSLLLWWFPGHWFCTADALIC